MDKKDLAILKELDKNPRASLKQIAKKTLLSKETVQYRVQKLESGSIISGYWGLPKIGNSSFVYKVFLKNKGWSRDEKSSFEYFISSQEETGWFAESTGSWNYIITLIGAEDWKISKLLADLFEKYSDKFIDIQITKCISAISLREKYLFDSPNLDFVEDNFLDPSISLTSVENKIISLVNSNARIQFSKISNELDITPEAVSYRFKQIMKKGALVDLKLRVNHSKLGYQYYHLMSSFSSGQSIREAEMYFASDNNSVFMMRHVGKYQLHTEIVCKHEDINNIVNSYLDKFSDTIQNYDLCKIEKEFKIGIRQ